MDRDADIKNKVKNTAKEAKHKRNVVKDVRERAGTTKPQPDFFFCTTQLMIKMFLPLLKL